VGDDTLTGGLGHDIYVIDALGDTVLEAEDAGTDEVRTALGSRSYFAAMYTLPDHVENLTGTSTTGQGVYGNALDNHIKMGAGGDLIVVQDGGNDRVESGGGNDYIFYGASFTSADSNNGGAGFDTVGLLGSYTLTFDADDLVSIEKLAVYSSGNPAAPNGYTLTTIDANVAAGEHLTVIGMSLGKAETLVFNGAAETNGRFTILGGRADDTLTGGAGNDLIWGNLGADTLKGGGGNDSFEYYAIADSTAEARDTILDFSGGDKINLFTIDADGNATNGNSRFVFIGDAAFGEKAGELRVTQSGDGWLVEGDVNGDGLADLAILVHTTGGHILGASDFVL
jgi:Ca2+-binding RTX toxin-like protein